jgi:pre-rRNA-processing protein TSR2
MSAEQQQQLFVEAVNGVFGEWTAISMAVENEWAGGATRERALALLARVLDGLLGSATVYRDEVEDLLEAAMVDDFNVEAEDESCRQVAELLCALHAEAKAGSTVSAQAVLARTAGKRTWVHAALPPRQRTGESSSDDDCSSDDEEGGGGGGGSSAMDAEEAPRAPRPEPVVDEDGFTMVSKNTRSRGRRS